MKRTFVKQLIPCNPPRYPGFDARLAFHGASIQVVKIDWIVCPQRRNQYQPEEAYGPRREELVVDVTATLDANHPLAGKTLTFDIKCFY